jgi:hypothetical protein
MGRILAWVRAGRGVTASLRLAFLISVRHEEVNSFQYQKEAHLTAAGESSAGAGSDTSGRNLAYRRMDRAAEARTLAPRGHPPPGRDGAEGEGKVMQNLLLGVGIGLLGALAVLTARYVAAVLAG